VDARRSRKEKEMADRKWKMSTKSHNEESKIKNVVPLLNQISFTPWRRMSDWRFSSTILDLGTRKGLLVSFTITQLYSHWKETRYPLDRRLGGPQRKSGRCGAGRNLLPVPGIEFWPSITQKHRVIKIQNTLK
jgi:hypothetical protein